ncbi:MAG TPA: SAM-dependent methyltransferase [Pyrinomonadaceae bacterium]|nr:SAM-dependent methyltransferase [Pyrinomonadaceae bacterium]
MSALSDRLLERIRAEGPITFYEWMRAALYDPDYGYYSRSDLQRWGRQGDYRTSPERSALFGATFARYFATLHKVLGDPERFVICEVGGGEGHFAETVLHTLHDRFPEIFQNTDYVFDEISTDAQSRAKKRLASFSDRVQFKSIEDLNASLPKIIFSNELLDAFPVHRVTMRDGKLFEFYVQVDGEGNFQWFLGELSTERLRLDLVARMTEGQTAEVSPGMEDWLEQTYKSLGTGYVVTVDYGFESHDNFRVAGSRNGTLRAFQGHQLVSEILASPGEHDITTSIDWTRVFEVGTREGLEVVTFQRQDQFLLQAGLLEELETRVDETTRESDKLRLRTEAREMILPGGMAQSFQVLVQKKRR